MDEVEEPPAQEPPVEAHKEPPAERPAEPAKRGRGRPPEAKNKVKVVIKVEPPAPPEPPAPEPVAAEAPVAEPRPKRVRKAPVAAETVVAHTAPATPHATFLTAMQAWQQLAAQDRASRSARYHNLVDSMFR